MNIENKLLEKGIRAKKYSAGTQKIKCPECQPPHNSQDRPLSLTIDVDGLSAVWFCHHCEHKGGVSNETNVRPMQTQKTYKKPEMPSSQNKPNDMYKFFAERCISKETVDGLGIFEDKGWYAFPYVDEKGEVVNIKYRTKDKRFKQSKDAKKSLYNYQNVKDTEQVIFVEGEMDVLSLYEIGYTNTTTLSDGAPQTARYNQNDTRFKALQDCPLQAKNIILFLDSDNAGKSLHDELLHRFGKDICWYVNIPKDCKDANDVLVKHGSKTLKQLIENAIPYPIDGLYRVNDYKSSVIDLYNGNYIKPIEVGFPQLDEIYKVLKGTFHTITGIPNHGKSYFLDNMLMKITQNHNWKFAIFSPEHSSSMHIRRMAQMYCQKPFDQGDNDRMSKDELEDAMTYMHEYFHFIESKESIPTLDYILDKAKAAIRKYGTNGLIIDPFNEVSATRKSGTREDEHIRDFISKCKKFARVHDIVIWVVAHPTKLPKANDGGYLPPTAYDISGASHWHNQSDAILTVHRDFDDNSTTIYTRKIREQDLYGSIGTAKFTFDMQKRVFKPYVRTVNFDEPPSSWTTSV
jgi:twinkle protein